ncbi:hypothetical protein [Algoriphagus namhaensis]
MKTLEIIEKERLSEIAFSRNEVLSNPEDRKIRHADLERAQTLGNLLQTKVKITFESLEGIHYQVQTTVWAVGTDYISLKGGKTIPVRAILSVT